MIQRIEQKLYEWSTPVAAVDATLHMDVSVEQQFHEWSTPMTSVAATVAERYALRTTVLRMEGTDGLSPYNSCTMIHASSNSSMNRTER